MPSLLPRARLFVAVLAVASTAVAVPARVSAAQTALTPEGQGILVFIGDSLTVGADAFGALATNLRRSRTWTSVVMDAKDGRTASQGAATLAARMRKSRNTTAVVVALGTNDMISQRAVSYPAAVIEKVMNESLGVPVLWVTPTFSRTIRPDWRQRALRFTRALRAAQDEWPNLYVADWGGEFAPAGKSRFIADGVHLTVSGYRTRATWTLRQLSVFGRAIIDATTTTAPTTSTTTTTTTPATLPTASTSPPTTSPPSTSPTSSPPTSTPGT